MKVNQSELLPHTLSYRERWLIAICTALLLPALLINLGLLAVIEDEAIRALVALEIWYSGDFIAPTINGVPYVYKPPLYNWIILLSFKLFGNAEEFSLRFPTVIFTLVYGGLVYHLYREPMGKLAAVSIAFLTITCGRIFFFDSFLGLIDMCFSMCMFSLMIGTYHLAKEERWNALFIFAYTLTAIGFLLKTYPAIVFCGLSLLVILIAEKQFKKFFTWGHLIGILIFSTIVLGYYYAYSLSNDIGTLMVKMASESTDRTILKFGLLKTIKHLFTFPFEVFYHFLPWTILIVYLFKKNAFSRIWDHPFLRMNVLLLGANIILYWTSPQVYARYLLMFPPLMFAPLFYLHQINQKENSLHYKIVKGLFFLVVGIVVVGSASIFFIDRISFVPYRYMKAIALCGLCGLGLYFLYSAKQFRMLYIFFFVIIFRIGFNWFVMPDRNANDYANTLRVSATEAALVFGDRPMYTTTYQGKNRSVSYYMTRKNKRILQKVNDPPSGIFMSAKKLDDCEVLKIVKSRRPKEDFYLLECQ